MSFEEIITYIVTPILAGAGAIWAVAKVIIPRLVEAKLEGQRDIREHHQATENVAVEILREMIKERSAEIVDLTRAIDGLTRAIEINNKRVSSYNELITALSRAIDHLREELKK